LHDWLSNLQVHQVQSGKSQKGKPPTPKKLRRKRKSDEMDDFIEDSDGDSARSTVNGKNAILLVGPPGSGKTASVFAVARQLGFEVFEIHPGMRRSARDIQDKVGDMTQNHLVQQSSSLSRESSASIGDETLLTHGHLPANQKTMAAFMNSGAARKGKQQKLAEPKESKDPRAKSQKQSLILFEEVDILFEEDKGFWSHVIWLIKTSKRPVILTCNDTESVPLDELDLFTLLRYDRPEIDLAVQHLGHVAAAEGHLLSKEALKSLYLAKGQDLRAAITELNLWCQMTVGSQQGGLDWMLSYRDKQESNFDDSITRIVSQDTYISGLDLLPEQFEDTEDLIRFAQASLDISPLDWVEDDVHSITAETTPAQMLTVMTTLSDAKSAMDLFDDPTAASILAGAMKGASLSSRDTLPAPRDEVVRLYLNKLHSSNASLTPATISATLSPLLEESRIGLPTGLGRKSPSLDNPSALSVVTEVAPYIRSIVSHDQHLERLRNAMHNVSQTGSTKRQRRTRASRAAMEGGNKGTTRRDKWFPEELDWDAVLGTGNDWPTARDEDCPTTRGEEEGLRSDMGSKEQTPGTTSSSSTNTEPEVKV
jgi:DNA polymerase III delta prime subunit